MRHISVKSLIKEIIRLKKMTIDYFAYHTGKDPKTVEADMERDLYMSAESQNYNASIVSVSCDSFPDITFKDKRVMGLIFTEGTPIKLKVQLNYHDYCSMEVKAYGNKV